MADLLSFAKQSKWLQLPSWIIKVI